MKPKYTINSLKILVILTDFLKAKMHLVTT